MSLLFLIKDKACLGFCLSAAVQERSVFRFVVSWGPCPEQALVAAPAPASRGMAPAPQERSAAQKGGGVLRIIHAIALRERLAFGLRDINTVAIMFSRQIQSQNVVIGTMRDNGAQS
ncbi:MAG: hypothetical protein RBR77_08985 [Thauera sp.]|jgi:hypothetical protein|nr:hypothetical protein [Thauera sp.]